MPSRAAGGKLLRLLFRVAQLAGCLVISLPPAISLAKEQLCTSSQEPRAARLQETDSGEAVGGGKPEASLRVQYLGSGGVSLRLGSDHILTAPFFSNPSFGRVAFLRIATDESRFPPWLGGAIEGAQAILVGHSHYDHLMDVPLIARRLPAGAVIYGNETAAHILAGDDELPLRVESVDSRAGTHTKPGEWIRIPGTSVRFMAIRSGHAPHFMGMTWYDGSWRKDLDELPRRAGGWRMGQPHTFVIDFLEPGSDASRFRIFYQDAASNEPEGFPPALADGKPFDLAILCVASFSKVKCHPEAILAHLNPRAVLLTHWENFFKSPLEPPEPVPFTDVDEFLDRFEAALPKGIPWCKPDPGEDVSIPLP